MVFDHFEAADRYQPLHPGIGAALDVLRSRDWATVEDGRHPFDGERLFAIIARDQGRGTPAARLEFHQRYIDIQIALEGDDLIGWRARSDCRDVATPYDADRDVGFFHDPPAIWFPLHRQHFAIFFPEDAHAPLAGSDLVRKLVFKIAVDW